MNDTRIEESERRRGQKSVACDCTEHRCEPPAIQTTRYLVAGLALCASCSIKGHMATTRRAA